MNVPSKAKIWDAVHTLGIEQAYQFLQDWIAEQDAKWLAMEAPHYDAPWKVPPFPGRAKLTENWRAVVMREYPDWTCKL